MPVATQAGVFGMGGLPSSGPGPRTGSRSCGGIPSRVQNVSFAWPRRDLQGGDGRAGLLQDGPRLFHIEPIGRADPESLLGDGQNPLLDSDVVPGDLDPLLGDSILHVIRGHVRQQRHQGIIVAFDGRIQSGVVRVDIAPDAAPQVELPAQIEAVEPVGERSRSQIRWNQ